MSECFTNPFFSLKFLKFQWQGGENETVGAGGMEKALGKVEGEVSVSVISNLESSKVGGLQM